MSEDVTCPTCIQFEARERRRTRYVIHPGILYPSHYIMFDGLFELPDPADPNARPIWRWGLNMTPTGIQRFLRAVEERRDDVVAFAQNGHATPVTGRQLLWTIDTGKPWSFEDLDLAPDVTMPAMQLPPEENPPDWYQPSTDEDE